GALPQVWVIVDSTPPTVGLTSVAIRGGRLAVLWRATDTNLGARPITLSYAENAAGPWTLIAANLPNTGCYQWQVPANLPPRLLIRVEAADQAGNVGVAQTPEPILVGPSRPSGLPIIILTINPAEAK